MIKEWLILSEIVNEITIKVRKASNIQKLSDSPIHKITKTEFNSKKLKHGVLPAEISLKPTKTVQTLIHGLDRYPNITKAPNCRTKVHTNGDRHR